MLFFYHLIGAMLQDKIALVTGGATGIGKAIGLQIAKNRAKVAIASRNHSRLVRAAAEFERLGLPVLPIAMDVRKKYDIQRVVDEIAAKWGAIQILVNNAGISGLSMIDDPDDSKWFDILDTNLNGLYLMTKTVLKQMPDHSGGRVINISSVLGKFGVAGYTDSRAEAWEDTLDEVEDDPLSSSATALAVNDALAAGLWGQAPRLQAGQLVRLESEFAEVVSVESATSLTVRGDFRFGRGVRVTGDVVLESELPQEIPDDTVLTGR